MNSPDDASPAAPTHDPRRRVYELERALARRILAAPPDERASVARDAYAELYRQFPWEDQIALEGSDREAGLRWEMEMLGPWIPDGAEVLEAGCGAGEFLRALAPRCRRCLGIDMTEDVLPTSSPLPNLQFRALDIVAPDLPAESFDRVISIAVLEHLHPDDAPVHLAHIRRLLRPGGAYVLQTPNRITGPHDFSRGFDRTATGLHLKEWCYGSLIRALKAAGYARVDAQLLPRRLAVRSERLRRLGVRRAALKVPIERTIALVPPLELRTRLGRLFQIDQVVIAAWR